MRSVAASRLLLQLVVVRIVISSLLIVNAALDAQFYQDPPPQRVQRQVHTLLAFDDSTKEKTQKYRETLYANMR